MSTLIICIILVIIAIYAIQHARSHYQGESGCCGGTVTSHHKELSHILDQKIFLIQGMHCQNCAHKIENAINEVSYLVCHVDLLKQQAVISSSQMIDDLEIQSLIEKCGYHLA